MKHSQWMNRGLLAGVALSAALAGCVVVPAGGPYYGGVVVTEPPAPIVETYGVAPTPGYVWLGGYWNWVGGRHVWVAGHWDRPHPGYRWEPHHWERTQGGWRLHEGRWVRH